jgi:hypothetical protein
MFRRIQWLDSSLLVELTLSEGENREKRGDQLS